MNEQKPSVGRIVHFWQRHNIVPRAAIVTYINADSMDLTVFVPQSHEGGSHGCGVSTKPGKEHMTAEGYWWEWPPRDGTS